MNLHRPLKMVFPLSEHEYSSEDVGLTLLNLFHVENSVCGYQCHVFTSYHQYYTGTQLTGSVTLDDKGTMQLSGGSSRLLDRPSLLNRAFNHFKL